MTKNQKNIWCYALIIVGIAVPLLYPLFEILEVSFFTSISFTWYLLVMIVMVWAARLIKKS